MSFHHFSHDHPLILKEELDANGDDEIVCFGCRKPIIHPGSAVDVYICSSSHGCDDFYLHKSCAELPKEIKYHLHDQHPLTLHARPPYYNFSCYCDVCNRHWEGFTYNCLSCNFDSCVACGVTCTFEDREFHHIGHKHKQHTLTLMQREALFKCDACGTKAEDLSYACNSCPFWMHKSCASSPTTVEPNFHHHPLVLTYSLPHIHRTFKQYCGICKDRVLPSYWLYYCYKCTYFVHMKCVASSKTLIFDEKDDTEIEPQGDVDEHNLVQFPVESFMNLIINQFAKGNINLEKGEASPDHPQIIKHWSHGDHPLILLEEVQRSENNEMLICNGCIQPISTAHPFYGCIRCNFFLHRFCVELPMELPAGEHSCHPEHPLFIHNNKNKFYTVRCDACGLLTNGFYFWCKTCKKRFDICCCFLPNKIKHESHKHPLVNRASTKFICTACGNWTDTDYFKCETACSSFQIDKNCTYLFPRIMRHRWDPHPIPLIYPPFPHEGVIYCEICEEEIDPNYWLYHCSECDQSFHTSCLRSRNNVKLGDKVVVGIHPHTLTFVSKKKSVYGRPLLCGSCGWEHLGKSACLFFECVNCDILFCTVCVRRNV